MTPGFRTEDGTRMKIHAVDVKLVVGHRLYISKILASVESQGVVLLPGKQMEFFLFPVLAVSRWLTLELP